jgi:Family of unknown function (DUF6169)
MRRRDINLSNRYELVTTDSDDFYTFTTDFGVLYRLDFKNNNSLLTIYKGLFEFVEFAFEPIKQIKGNKKPVIFDEKIRNTIEYALLSFFEEPDKILYYVCDSSDGRQLSRERLFKNWFAEQSLPISQLEVIISAELKALIFIHNSFPFIEQLKEDLSESGEFYSSQK